VHEKHGKVVEENVAAQELKPIEGEEYVVEEALTKDEIQCQKRLAWISLIVRSLNFTTISLSVSKRELRLND
jgi:hypothetical protein